MFAFEMHNNPYFQDNSMTTVIHPTSWSQHTFVLGLCFFWDALYENCSQFDVYQCSVLDV